MDFLLKKEKKMKLWFMDLMIRKGRLWKKRKICCNLTERGYNINVLITAGSHIFITFYFLSFSSLFLSLYFFHLCITFLCFPYFFFQNLYFYSFKISLIKIIHKKANTAFSELFIMCTKCKYCSNILHLMIYLHWITILFFLSGLYNFIDVNMHITTNCSLWAFTSLFKCFHSSRHIII